MHAYFAHKSAQIIAFILQFLENLTFKDGILIHIGVENFSDVNMTDGELKVPRLE